MNKLKIFIAVLFCLIGVTVKAQNTQIQGTVRDDQGTVPGVSVTEKGLPGNGTATDMDGKFRISLKGSSNVLVFSSVGYLPKEVNVAGNTTVSVTLVANAKALDEVVVVGFGQQKKITVTGAASSITGTELRKNPSPNIQNTLMGKITGFVSQQRTGRPGADGATFYIRGVSSYTGANQPLIVVDDIDFTYDQFSRLDANEVESVTLLKDASTTAIYGIKGANGVVVVTTRRGKVGPPSISFRSEFSMAQPTILPKYVDAYNAALMYNTAQINDNQYAATPNPNFQPRFTAQDLELYKNGQDPYGHPNVDWKDALFKKSSGQQRYNMDVSGGTEKVKYFISLGYLNQGGITKDYSEGQGIDGNYYNHRYNYRSNMDVKATSSLDLKLSLSGNISEINQPNVLYPGKTNGGKNDLFAEFGSFLSTVPFAYPIKNPDGSWGYSTWQRNEVVGGTYDSNNLIERMTLFGYNRNFENNMNLSISANQNLASLVKGLSLKGTVSYASTFGSSRSETRSLAPSYIYTPATNAYEPRDQNVYRIEKLNLGGGPGTTSRQLNLQASLNYDNTFGDHHVSALALINQSSLTRQVSDVTYNFIPNNFRGFTGRVNYDYKQKYLLEISGAYNGTDRFTADKRYGLFPAASVGWNVAEENIVKNNLKFLDQFKLRASYGMVGSDDIGGFSYSYLQTYSNNNLNNRASFGVSDGNSNIQNAIKEGTLPNADVSWEKEKKLDLGIDFSFFKKKVSGSFDYFDHNRYDILSRRGTISTLFGQTLPPVNLGKTNNHGIELELMYRDKVGKDIGYSFKGTYSTNHNKVLFRDEASTLYPYQQATGHSIGANYIYKWTGEYYQSYQDIANHPKVMIGTARPGDLIYQDLNSDGLIDGNDKSFFGYTNIPEKIYGMEFTANYKNFSVRALFQAATNFNLSAFSEAIRPFSANLTSVHQQAWTSELGNNAKFPGLTLSPQSISDVQLNNSTFYYTSGNYLRLKTAEVSYSIPAKLLQRIKIKDARIYLNGYNLLTWSKAWDLYSLDPEVSNSSDRIVYPPEKLYNLGLNITF